MLGLSLIQADGSEYLAVFGSSPGGAIGGPGRTAQTMLIQTRGATTPAETSGAGSFGLSGSGTARLANQVAGYGNTTTGPRTTFQVGNQELTGRQFARWMITQMQSAVDAADARWQGMSPRERASTSKRPANLKYGSFIDSQSRFVYSATLKANGVSEGRFESVRINRAMWDSMGRLSPDVLIAGHLYADVSVSEKTATMNNQQLGRTAAATGLLPWVIRPTSLGGSYRLSMSPIDTSARVGYSAVLPPQVLSQMPAPGYSRVAPRPRIR